MSAADLLMARSLLALGCVVTAGVLAFSKRDGCGWFLFAAAAMAPK